MTKEEMATISAKAERYIGTQGGGMDQAIAFLGKAGEKISYTRNYLHILYVFARLLISTYPYHQSPT